MHEYLKAARSGSAKKAKDMTTATSQKVDSSSWTPAEPLNTTAKTGMRPISKRAFKSGGKVAGKAAKVRHDRMARKSGGRVEKPTEIDSLINRDDKRANEHREGVKHVGALKRGGRAKKADGGDAIADYLEKNPPEAQKPVPMPPRRPDSMKTPATPAVKPDASKYMTGDTITRGPTSGRKDGGKAQAKCGGGRAKRVDGGLVGGTDMPMGKGTSPLMNRGGRTKKQAGGPMLAGPAAPNLMKKRMMQVPTSVVGPNALPRKDGGFDKFEGSKKDEAQDKKLAKKHGMSMKSWEKSKMDEKHDKQKSMKGLKTGGRTIALRDTWENEKGRDLDKAEREMQPTMKSGGRAKRKDGGGVFTGEGYPNKVPGAVGGRTARASGGRAKGKTNINIVIAPQGQADASGMPMPPMPIGGPKPPMGPPPPMPMPMPPQGGPQGVDPSMLAALAGKGAGGPPQPPMGMPPMARKAGGRVYRSYKDMDAGAGSGLGRLEKTEIEEKKMARKDGGRAYPITTGSGGGNARLEKIPAYGLKQAKW